jgi:PAS domain S-box-containing protein
MSRIIDGKSYDLITKELAQCRLELRDSKELFRLVSENIHDLLFVKDTAQNRYLFVSPTYARIYGQPVEEAYQNADLFLESVHPDDQSTVAQAIEDQLLGQPTNLEYRVLFPDGHIQWVHSRAVPVVDHDGEIRRVIGIVQEITDRKNAEEGLRQVNASLLLAQQALKDYSERLEEMVLQRTLALEQAQEKLLTQEKLAVLGKLAGSVGHELRNPLGAILNSVYILGKLIPGDNEKIREYLGVISAEVDNANLIIADLLGFARIPTPEKQAEPVVELVAQTLARFIPPENIEVLSNFEGKKLFINVDARQIKQVLANLVTNAYQAMPEGGTLTLSTKKMDPMVALDIMDSGCGISQENMKRLFEPLLTTKARGIGLGLIVSKMLVEANGGSIIVTSEAGKGSTFTLLLPEAYPETRD